MAFEHNQLYRGVFWLVVAVALKGVPIFALPVLLLVIPRMQRLRALFLLIVFSLALLILISLPMGFGHVAENLQYFYRYHQERGIEVGSSWSSFHMLNNKFLNEYTPVVNHHRAVHVDSLGSLTVFLSALTALLGLIFFYILLFWWRPWLRLQDFTPLAMVALLWVIGSGTVLSPQFFMWIVPVIIAWILHQIIHRRVAEFNASALAFLVVVIGLLTQRLILPGRFHVFAFVQTWEAVLTLFVRNMLLFSFVIILLITWYRSFLLPRSRSIA